MLKRSISDRAFEVWAQGWSRLSRQWRDRSVDLLGWFVEPYPGQPFVHSMHVDARVLSKSDVPCEFRLVAGGETLAAGTTPAGVIASEHGPGWHIHAVECFLTPARLARVRVNLLRLVVTTDTASSTVAVTPIRRVRRAKVTDVRGNYGDVWNKVSRDAHEARVSVAGYADDDEWIRSGLATAEYVTRSLALTPHDRVLEIGCGTGRIGRHIAPRCGHWTGADVSSNMLAFAARELAALRNTSFVRLNGFDLSGIDDGSFDAVYCSAVFMHMDEWDRFRYVQEAMRVLRRGGRLFVDNYNLLGEAGWQFFLTTARLDVAIRPPHVSRSSTPQELEQYLRAAGFIDIRVEPGAMFVTAIGVKPPVPVD